MACRGWGTSSREDVGQGVRRGPLRLPYACGAVPFVEEPTLACDRSGRPFHMVYSSALSPSVGFGGVICTIAPLTTGPPGGVHC